MAHAPAATRAPAAHAPAATQAPATRPRAAPTPPVDAPAPAARAPARAARAASGSLRIDIDRLRAGGYLVPDAIQSPIGQEFRVIKRPLLGNAFGRGTTALAHGRRVMVTSALPNEGKSFCAINLAMSIAAERDHQVLLVDADVARPSLPRELGVPHGPGLMDLLDGATDSLDDFVSTTNVEKLSLLRAGRSHDHSTELLASERMSLLLDRLSERYADRIIIFDSPPLLVTTESRVLATYMGQIVMVVAAGSTPRSAVDEALELVANNGVVGIVLNKARDGAGGAQYGYQGYGYGSDRTN